MLAEFHHVKQENGSTLRRWFEGGGLELIVWYARPGEPSGFQLCYQANDQRERALTWRREEGFSHAMVDAGDSRPDKNLTPILIKDGPVPWRELEASFVAQSAGLEPALRDCIRGILKQGAG
jgi:hypothetical protein